MHVTKIDAARRQLVTAIRLFFDGGDPVSVYSLASNAWKRRVRAVKIFLDRR
jgi:hypothetical protein